jgi:hypothetical protein
MKSYFICGCLALIVSIFAKIEAHDEVELSGRLVRKYYPAPAIVLNRAFGWFLELDEASKRTVFATFNQLNDSDKKMCSWCNFNIVQLMPYRDHEREECRDKEDRYIALRGKLSSFPNIFGTIPCYQLDLDYGVEFRVLDDHCSENSLNLAIDTRGEELIPVAEGYDESLTQDPGSYGVDITNLSDVPLEFREGSPEMLVTLKGKLSLRLYPGPPEYSLVEAGDDPEYHWMLHMDVASFWVAAKTPVGELGRSLQDIMQHANWFEVDLGRGSEEEEDFYCQHVNQDVIVQGYLFHSHTAHHRSPFVMDVKEISE